MSKERLKSPRMRLFVALELPDRIAAGLAAWGARELRDPALRPVAPGALHLTLVFLGYQRQRDLDAIAAALEPAGGEVAMRICAAPLPRPARGRARLFAVEVESPGAVRLQAALSERLERDGFHQREGRAFWPHITVARVRPEAKGSRRPAPVQSPPGTLPGELLDPFGAVRITLYRSELRHQGAEYSRMAQIELPAGDGSGQEN